MVRANYMANFSSRLNFIPGRGASIFTRLISAQAQFVDGVAQPRLETEHPPSWTGLNHFPQGGNYFVSQEVQ